MLDAPIPLSIDGDGQCLATGDEYLHLALRCYAAAILSDAEIAQRVTDQAGISFDAPDQYEAACVIARHCALMDVPLRKIIALLAYLAAEIPCWPDADDIAEIAEAAIAECAT